MLSYDFTEELGLKWYIKLVKPNSYFSFSVQGKGAAQLAWSTELSVT